MRVNAVFEGGGVKAIGLVGGIRAAEQFGFTFHHVAGTSSGAIVAALLSAGYRSEEMRHMLAANPFPQFVQKSMWDRIYGIGPTLRLFIKKGLHSQLPLKRWITEKLHAKGIERFADVPSGSLRIIASDITRGKMLVLPDDLQHYGINPDAFHIADAVVMSAALPYFFDPAMIRLADKQICYIVDGAILSNFPLWLFDRSTYNGTAKIVPTIGYHLVGKQDHVPNKIKGPISMFRALFSTMMNAHDEKYIDKFDRFRTIKIPTLGIKTTDFDLSAERIEQLYESGLQAGRDFFMKWSVSDYFSNYEEIIVNKYKGNE